MIGPPRFPPETTRGARFIATSHSTSALTGPHPQGSGAAALASCIFYWLGTVRMAGLGSGSARAGSPLRIRV